MGAFKTHYDNLQVARNANPEVISAAYRSLSRKFHPDQNAGDPRCEEIMRILNRAYEVLSDPQRRAAYDRIIAEKEAEVAIGAPTAPMPSPPPRPELISKEAARAHLLGYLVLVVGLVGFIGLASLFERQSPSSRWKPYETSLNRTYDRSLDRSADATAPQPVADSVRTQPANKVTSPTSTPTARAHPTSAPNGSAWPKAAGYVNGYPRLNSGGLSTLTIDNRANSSAVFVKLFSLFPVPAKPVRHVFIPAFGEFTARNLASGEYDVRYLDLSDGSLSRSESFVLSQTKEPGGIRYSNVTMTLYKVPNGNMQTFPINYTDF